MQTSTILITIALIIIVLGIFRITQEPVKHSHKKHKKVYFIPTLVPEHHKLGPGGIRKPIIVKYEHLLGPGGNSKIVLK